MSSRPISHWGKTDLKTPLSLEFYKTWLDQGYNASMDYLKTHLPLKANPKLLGLSLKSSLIFCFPYLPHPEGEAFPLKNLQVAQYAKGNDYHFWIKSHLSDLSADLKSRFPEEEFLVLTDSGPIMERDLAYRAGLGWIGKNTCLIDRKEGSYFLIGEILTSLPLQNNLDIQVQPDFCGTCTACIDICPTQAIKEPRLIDAGLCISYLTIESREVPPKELRSKIGNWFFGCDLCQSVCPWNKKVFKSLLITPNEGVENKTDLKNELQMILNSSGKTLTRLFKGTPLQRAGPFGLKRNAMLVAANLKITDLEKEIENYLEHEKLAELADWCLKELRKPV